MQQNSAHRGPPPARLPERVHVGLWAPSRALKAHQGTPNLPVSGSLGPIGLGDPQMEQTLCLAYSRCSVKAFLYE